MLLYYVRHGDPIYDPDQLTPLGKRQAEAVARRLARYGLDEIYVSSSTRAKQTAAPTCEILKKEPVVLDWTNEAYAWRQLTVKNFPLPRNASLFKGQHAGQNIQQGRFAAAAFAQEKVKAGIGQAQIDVPQRRRLSRITFPQTADDHHGAVSCVSDAGGAGISFSVLPSKRGRLCGGMSCIGR